MSKLFEYLIQEANWIPLGTNLQEIRDIVLEEEGLKWIPVSERLPGDGNYLVYSKWEHISVCGLYKKDWTSEEGSYMTDDVLAWMPLPKPYDPIP